MPHSSEKRLSAAALAEYQAERAEHRAQCVRSVIQNIDVWARNRERSYEELGETQRQELRRKGRRARTMQAYGN